MNCGGQIAMNVLEIQGLSKLYRGRPAVDDVDLHLQPGESLAVIGHNGAGKTTLMKLILGLTRPTRGSISRWAWDGGKSRPTPASDAIGFLPESVTFPGSLSGHQMLRFYGRLKKVGKSQCNEMLELVGLAGAADQKISTYSKGMRQRLGLAQALLGKPDLLLLDEPTSGLDPFLRQHFYDIVGQRQSSGASLILSSHALTEIEARTDRIAIMKHGRLLEQGSLSALRQKAALPVIITVHYVPGMLAELRAIVPGSEVLQSSDGQRAQISCPQEQKIALLRQLTSRPDIVQDIGVRPPGLDDLYTYFVNGVGE